LLHGTASLKPRGSGAPPPLTGPRRRERAVAADPTAPCARVSKPPRAHSMAARSRTGERARWRGGPRRRRRPWSRSRGGRGEAGGGSRGGERLARISGKDAARGFCPSEVDARPSILIGRSRSIRGRAGRFWPRRGTTFPAQAQVAAWCAGEPPACAVAR
jgi:hypothetical protein